MIIRQTLQQNTWATLKVLLLIAICTLIAFTFASCNSKSGQLAKQPFEKVVIIDSYPSIDMPKTHDGKMYHYKVKRFTKGVVTDIFEYSQYEQGDTIYHRFPN